MAIRIYNTQNQALNAKKMADLLSFATDDFAGVIVDDWDDSSIQNPTIYDSSNNSWYWNQNLKNKQITFVGAGISLEYDVPAVNNSTGAGKFSYPINNYTYLFGLDVIVPNKSSSIVSDNGRIWLSYALCSSIEQSDRYIVVTNPSGNPALKEYYEYISSSYVLTQDTSVIANKVYYYRIEKEAFKVEGAQFIDRTTDQGTFLSGKTFEYYGNTIWIQKNLQYDGGIVDRFFIPICYRYNDGGTLRGSSMIFRRDKSAYRSFLSAQAYNNLLQEIGDKFVWKAGGTKKGDIGELNVTGKIISNKDVNSNGVIINFPIFNNVSRLANKSEGSRSSGLNSILVLDEDNKPKKIHNNFIVDRSHGGTGAADIDIARRNLHFSYGTSIPKNIPYLLDNKTKDYGAVYFKIIE